jgi:uncharacterized protein
MKRHATLLLALAILFAATASAGQPRFKMLAFYSTSVEPDHVLFAEDALKFFTGCAAKDGFQFDATTNWENLNDAFLKTYQVVVWLNESPTNGEQRHAFQRYMENGGAWLGFHAAGYNDKDTNWPWFVDFLGGAVFYTNSWPPLPARLVLDDRTHEITDGIPQAYDSPANEWYIWKPSPRLNSDVRVLVTLDPSNYPLGLKDVLTSGDLPAVWTNTKYKMIYMNIGHGDKIFTSSVQNQLIENAVNWLGRGTAPKHNAPARGERISPHGVVLNPKTHKIYAVNISDGSVAVLDGTSRHVTVVKVGTEPEAIAVNPATNQIYVANTGSGNVSVIDGLTDKVVATVAVGELPYVIAANPVTNKIYVSKTFSNTMTVIDGTTNAASHLRAGMQADEIAVNPVSNRLYLIDYESPNVTLLDGVAGSDTTVPVGIHLWAIAVNPAMNRIYLSDTDSSRVAVVDGNTNATTFVKTGEFPCALAIDSSTGRVYAANYATNSVTVIDGSTNSAIATVRVGATPKAIAVDSVIHRIYVANNHSDTVTVIDGINNSIIATLKTGRAPYAVAVDSVNNRAVVSNMADDTLTVIDGKSLTAITEVMPTIR